MEEIIVFGQKLNGILERFPKKNLQMKLFLRGCVISDVLNLFVAAHMHISSPLIVIMMTK